MRTSARYLSPALATIAGLGFAQQALAASGGPDAFGYYYQDQADGATYAFVDISVTGTALGNGDDVLIPATTLGAPFTFYGEVVTQLRASTNGFLTSTTGASSDFSNDCPLPLTAGGGGFRIAALHDDLITTVRYQYFDQTGAAAVGYPGETAGISVFQWNGEHFPAGGGDSVGFEVILFHDDGTILTMVAQATNTGASSTTGIQNANASTGLNYVCNTAGSISPGVTAVRFSLFPLVTPPDSNCCDPSAGGIPGCTDASCEATVCAADAFCCNTEWDQVCAGEAANLCGALCNTCGDGNVAGGEECDTAGASATCDADCTFVVCGDGTVNGAAGEDCDDSGESATCNADCSAATCGDSIVNMTAGEQCDDGAESATCDVDCSQVACGDGTTNVTAGEDCDDSGESATCNADCSVAACGDSQVNASAGEACDDGGRSMTCNADCSLADCGDGIINATAGETCDDAGQSATCDADCTAASCGDGFVNVDAGEQCDDAGETAACDDDCTPALCGDGALNATAGEECDDGNTTSNDGCSAICETESMGNGGGGAGGAAEGGAAAGGAGQGGAAEGGAAAGGAPEGGSTADGGSGEGGGGGGTDGGVDDGCGCEVPGNAPSRGGLAALFAALGLAVIGRRRRRG